MNGSTEKTLIKKTRKIYISYPLDDVSKDYEKVKKLFITVERRASIAILVLIAIEDLDFF